MGKKVNKAAAVLIALVLALSQLSVVFADNGTTAGRESNMSGDAIRSAKQDRKVKRLLYERDSVSKPGQKVEVKPEKARKAEEDEIVPGQVIVKYKAGISSKSKKSLSEKVSAVSSESIPKLNITKLELAKGVDVDSAVDRLMDDPDVEYAEPVYLRKAFAMSNIESMSVIDSVYADDPFYTNGWQWGLEALNMENMWKNADISRLSNVIIAIVDSGVDADHPELRGNIIDGYDFVDNDYDPDDENGHGTHVAGIAAAAHDGSGMAGVAGGARIMPVRVLDDYGYGNTVGVVNGILYTVNNGADVINLSLGGYMQSRAEMEAVEYALSKGVTVVAAAGNDGLTDSIAYPAAYDGVIAVGAVDWNGSYSVAGFSNVGPQLDIFAPGVDILSTVPYELDNPGNRVISGLGDAVADGYCVASGTSMAAPFVSGMAAMLLAENPGWNCSAVMSRLQADGTAFAGSGIKVLNSGGYDSSINVRSAYLEKSKVNNNRYTFNLHFESIKGTVAEEVYGDFELYWGEFDYIGGFGWNDGPKALDDKISVYDGEGSITVDIPDASKNYVFYVKGTGGYRDSKPICIIPDESSSFYDAVDLTANIKYNGAIQTSGDEDYYRFYVGTEGYYAIESTGGIDTYGYLYDSHHREISYDDDMGPGRNFRIDMDMDNGHALFLKTGTYYVVVVGYDESVIGEYGITVKRLVTISGTISVPIGISEEDIHVSIKLVEDTYDEEDDELYYELEQETWVSISKGSASADYAVLADPGSEYAVEYQISRDNIDYAATGYYSAGGMTALYSSASRVPAGANNIDMTLIPLSAAEDNERNTFDTAASLPLEGTVNGTMHFDGDIDLYKLTVAEEGNYLVGVITDWYSNNYMYYGILFDSEADVVPRVGYTDKRDGGKLYKYNIYNLTAGDYYYAAYGYAEPFDVFNYQVSARKASVISGTVTIPSEIVDRFNETIEVIVEDSQGNQYTDLYKKNLENVVDYTIGVPPADGYIVSYYIYDRRGKERKYKEYAQIGYYSRSGTKADKASASVISATSDVSGINLSIIPITDSEGDIGAAVPIAIDTLVEGRLNDRDDVDYFRFEIPQGGGYYYIDISSNEYFAVYLYENGDWILYDETDYILIGGYFTAGSHYLKIHSTKNYYGYYSIKVISLQPMAKDVRISGTVRAGNTLTGTYTYVDAQNDAESGSTFRWLRSDTSNGTYSPIEGAVAKTYTLTQADVGKYVKFEVTPRNSGIHGVGNAVTSAAVGPVQAAGSSNSNPPSSGGGSKKKGGGGGGGGGGGKSTESAVTVSSNTEQAGAGTATIKRETDGRTSVAVQVDGSKLGNALGKAGSAPLVLDVRTKAQQDNLQVRIPSEVLSKASEGNKPVVINSNNVDLTIEPETFNEESLTGEVRLLVSQLPSDSVKDMIDRKDKAADEVSLVFDFDLLIGDRNITDFSKPLTITVRFDVSKVTNLSKVGVYYYNEKDGRWEYVGGKANPDGTITFTVDHFSKFAVMEYNRTFTDIAGHWAQADIELLISRHVARSESEASFAPNDYITRAAFASMVAKGLNLKDTGTGETFSDVAADAWYNKDVYKAYAAGIIGGVGGGKFAPEENITREQMAVMLIRAYEYATGNNLEETAETKDVRFTDEESISDWAKRSVILADAIGLVTGNPDSSYNPKGQTTKAQAVTVIKRLMEKLGRL